MISKNYEENRHVHNDLVSLITREGEGCMVLNMYDYMSAQRGYSLNFWCTMYEYATQIMILNYLYVRRIFKTCVTFVLVWQCH